MPEGMADWEPGWSTTTFNWQDRVGKSSSSRFNLPHWTRPSSKFSFPSKGTATGGSWATHFSRRNDPSQDREDTQERSLLWDALIRAPLAPGLWSPAHPQASAKNSRSNWPQAGWIWCWLPDGSLRSKRLAANLPGPLASAIGRL